MVPQSPILRRWSLGFLPRPGCPICALFIVIICTRSEMKRAGEFRTDDIFATFFLPFPEYIEKMGNELMGGAGKKVSSWVLRKRRLLTG